VKQACRSNAVLPNTLIVVYSIFCFTTDFRISAPTPAGRVTEFSVTGMALPWFRSYLSGRSQFMIKLSNHQSPAVSLSVGVPQASVPGPILFAFYCSPVGDDADNTQPCALTTQPPDSQCTSDVVAVESKQDRSRY